jgi:hypothetical protein
VTVSPATAAAGWRRSATVTLTGSAGTREIDWWASPRADGAAVRRGATLGSTKVRGSSATFTIRDEGWTVVRWYAIDRAGRHGPWQSFEVRIDRSPPEVSPPVITFVGDTVLGTASAATQVQWGGVDALSAGLRYSLQESRDGGPWRTVKPAGASTRSGGGLIVPRHLVVGSTYQYRVRATDAAGNAGTWRSGPVHRVTLIDSTDRRIGLAGTWRTVRDRDALGGSTLVASAAGATASLSVKGSAVALVAPTAIGRGSAIVRVDGASAGTAKFHRPIADGRIVWRTAWSAGAIRLIEVASRSSERIDIDAFLVLVEQVPVQAVLQAERCPTETIGGSPQPNTQAPAEAVGLALRGEGQLLWQPSGLDTLHVLVPVSVDGRYILTLFLSHGPAYGTIEVSVPSAAPPVFDLYAPSLSGPFAVGITDLPMAGPGGWPVEIRVKGRNTASTGYAVAIDQIVVTPAP